MVTWTKNLEKEKEKESKTLIRKCGKEWFKRNKESLDREWEWIVFMGFVQEDPNLPIKELSATEEELEARGLMRGINGKYHLPEMGPIVRINPTHNTCMNAFIRGYKKHLEEMEKKECK